MAEIHHRGSWRVQGQQSPQDASTSSKSNSAFEAIHYDVQCTRNMWSVSIGHRYVARWRIKWINCGFNLSFHPPSAVSLTLCSKIITVLSQMGKCVRDVWPNCSSPLAVIFLPVKWEQISISWWCYWQLVLSVTELQARNHRLVAFHHWIMFAFII